MMSTFYKHKKCTNCAYTFCALFSVAKVHIPCIIFSMNFQGENNMTMFAQRLKLLRKEASLSQQELANQLQCVSKSSINMYERGEREPGLETTEAIADYFNVDIDYLT